MRIAGHFDDGKSQAAVEVGDRFADGLASDAERRAASRQNRDFPDAAVVRRTLELEFLGGLTHIFNVRTESMSSRSDFLREFEIGARISAGMRERLVLAQERSATLQQENEWLKARCGELEQCCADLRRY